MECSLDAVWSEPSGCYLSRQNGVLGRLGRLVRLKSKNEACRAKMRGQQSLHFCVIAQDRKGEQSHVVLEERGE